MIKANWKQDYCKDFTCYKCQQAKLNLAGMNRGRQQLRCSNCNSVVQLSININRRSWFLDSRLVDEQTDWEKSYKGEFICPECQSLGMIVRGVHKSNNKRQFWCSSCKKTQLESCQINIRSISDPINAGLIWYTNHKIKGFVCPKCQCKNMYFAKIEDGKKRFRCRTCKTYQKDCLSLQTQVASRLNEKFSYFVTSFNFEDDKWDLRGINPNFGKRDKPYYISNFTSISQKWLKEKIKKYVLHLSKANNSFGTISLRLSALRSFSQYIDTTKVYSFIDINRSVILDYLSKEEKVTKTKLGSLRDFFFVGTIKGWFNIDQDIIRDEDYPKRRRGNPEPLSDVVREQIEQNLHQLPDFIARMWIICFFAAMRPSELALLKQDCLVQEGEHWKLIWQRKKSNDYHEVPISRTIAKVVQEQLSYIQDLWGQEWNYLFCHYHNISSTDSLQPNLEPFKRILPSSQRNPLLACIRTLIKDLDIRDENGQPAKFKAKLLRPTRLTQLFEQGHDLAVVSAWAGHKHFATTSTYYTKVSCDLIEQEAGHIQKALVNSEGHRVPYESFPKSFWEKPQAHKLELSGIHINTPIYGYCGLDLDQDCKKFRACYTCPCFVATPEKLPQYVKTRDELRGKQSKALAAGQDILVEQFGTQADQLDKIIASLQEAA